MIADVDGKYLKRSTYCVVDRSTREDSSGLERTRIRSLGKLECVSIVDILSPRRRRKESAESSRIIESRIKLSNRLYPTELSRKEISYRSVSPLVKKFNFTLRKSFKHLGALSKTQALIGKLEKSIEQRVNGSLSKSKSVSLDKKISVKPQKGGKLTQANSGSTLIHIKERNKIHKFVESDINLELLNHDGEELPLYMRTIFLKEKQ